MTHTPKDRTVMPRGPDWPEPDRRAWAALFAEGDILEGAGPARHWRPATRRTNRQHYARWLGWLAREGLLAPDRAPPDRADPEIVHRYARHLVDTVAPRTAASALIGLKVVMKAMAPERDWRWLMDLTNRLGTWAKPSVDRRLRQRPIDEIHRAALGELERLASTDLAHRRNRIRYRDAMILLVLSASPIRLRNLAGLGIGQQIRHEGERWAIHLHETETKGHNRLAYLLPRHIGPYMARYLGEVRPAYGPAGTCDALWLALGGRPLACNSVYGRIVEVTTRLLGMPINPHLFRSCAATSLVEEVPEAARLAAPLLGHRYFETTERYYVRAGQIEASRRVNALLGAIAGEEAEG